MRREVKRLVVPYQPSLLAGQELLPPGHPFAGMVRNGYKAVALDPPWKFNAGTKGRPQHYKRMTDTEIAALPIQDLCASDCFVFIWFTSPKMFHVKRPSYSPVGAIAEEWGLRFSARGFVWVKMDGNQAEDMLFWHKDAFAMKMGYTTRKNAEDCYLFKIGKPKRLHADVEELIVAPVRKHSEKPEEFYRRVERFCAGPYADIFSRLDRPGWTAWGDEAGKLNGARL